MVCKTSDYFSEKKIVSEIVIKFKMEDPKKKYHLPIILSPNGYSIWWSQ
jgi:5-hydroxyisourate hydrolase